MALICYVCYKLGQYSSTKIACLSMRWGWERRALGKCTHGKKVDSKAIYCDLGINEAKKVLVILSIIIVLVT